MGWLLRSPNQKDRSTGLEQLLLRSGPSTGRARRPPRLRWNLQNRPDGFDKGHLAPDATIKAFGRRAQRETYSLANITPQYSLTNQGIWRELEERIRSWATVAEPVCVETGPILENGRSVEHLDGPNQLIVPHAYYAIVTRGSEPSVISFIVPNEARRRSIADVLQYAASVDEIEGAVGVDFLANLEDGVERRVEAVLPEKLWKRDSP